ncbi:hypothetical protein JST99_01255 [Candidatus Dependentiae bacterium]|nr:hypothetical protein [Candidatus Dependentiae bacterium]
MKRAIYFFGSALFVSSLSGRCSQQQAYKSVAVVEEKLVVCKTGSNTERWCVVAVESRDGQPTLYTYGSIVARSGKASRRLRVPVDAEFFVCVDGGSYQKINIATYCASRGCTRGKNQCTIPHGPIKIWDIQLNIDDDKRVTIGPRTDGCLGCIQRTRSCYEN